MPSLIAILGLDGSKFSSALNSHKEEAQSKGGLIGSALGNGIKGALGAWAGMEGVKKVFGEMSKQGEEAHRATIGAARMGIQPEDFVRLDKAAGKYGLTAESLAGVFRHIAKGSVEALEGNTELVASFASLGVNLNDLKNKRVDELFGLMANNLKGNEVNAGRLTAMLKTMGKTADELIPAFKDGAFGRASVFADENGTIEKAEKFHKDMGVISGAMKRVWRDMFSPEANQNITGAVGFVADKVRSFFGMGKEAAASKPIDLKTIGKADLDADKTTAKNKAEEEKRLAKERLELEEKLFEVRQKNALDTLTKEQQIVELQKRRADLVNFVTQNWNQLSQENKLKAQIDLEEMLGKENQLNSAQDKKKTIDKHNVNELQKIGAFASSDPSLEINKKSERHLFGIYQGIQTLVQSARGGTQF